MPPLPETGVRYNNARGRRTPGGATRVGVSEGPTVHRVLAAGLGTIMLSVRKALTGSVRRRFSFAYSVLTQRSAPK